MAELLAFGLVVGLVLVVGIALGMLVAPLLTRWQDRQEAAGDDPDEPDPA